MYEKYTMYDGKYQISISSKARNPIFYSIEIDVRDTNEVYSFILPKQNVSKRDVKEYIKGLIDYKES